MAVFSGSTILNTNPAGAVSAATQPATLPILMVPAGLTYNIFGFALSNPTNAPIVVSLYRDFVGAAVAGSGLLFTFTVPALAGQPGGPAIVTQPYTASLNAGETIFAQTTNQGGFVNVEVDGLAAVASGGLSLQQLQLATLLMLHEAFGVDIPDSNTLNNGYTFS
jgi:hypothetical protein